MINQLQFAVNRLNQCVCCDRLFWTMIMMTPMICVDAVNLMNAMMCAVRLDVAGDLMMMIEMAVLDLKLALVMHFAPSAARKLLMLQHLRALLHLDWTMIIRSFRWLIPMIWLVAIHLSPVRNRILRVVVRLSLNSLIAVVLQLAIVVAMDCLFLDLDL